MNRFLLLILVISGCGSNPAKQDAGQKPVPVERDSGVDDAKEHGHHDADPSFILTTTNTEDNNEEEVAAQESVEKTDKPGEGNWTVHFSPKGGCDQTVTNLIKSAKKSVFVYAYVFTLPDMAPRKDEPPQPPEKPELFEIPSQQVLHFIQKTGVRLPK